MGWQEYVNLWLELWKNQTFVAHLLSALAGMMGASVYAVLTGPELKMWEYDAKTSTFEPNFLGTLLVGVVSAIIVDIAFPVGIVVGIIAPPTLRLILKFLPKAIVKAILSQILSSQEDVQ